MDNFPAYFNKQRVNLALNSQIMRDSTVKCYKCYKNGQQFSADFLSLGNTSKNIQMVLNADTKVLANSNYNSASIAMTMKVTTMRMTATTMTMMTTDF